MAEKLSVRYFIGPVFIFMVMMSGCQKSTEPDDNTQKATNDAAETIGIAVSEYDGGIVDQMGDVSDITTPSSDISLPLSSFIKTYNADSVRWTGTLTRERGNISGLYYSYINRVYEWQFLKGDVPQSSYINGTDTAMSIIFKILSGNTYAFSPRLKHHVTSLIGSWIITNTNSPDSIVTINGTAARNAIDTLTTLGAVRILNNQLDLTYTDIMVKRGGRSRILNTLSGTISGTYNATVTFLSGNLYSERNITRTFTITFVNGTAVVSMGNTNYVIDLVTG